MGLAVDLAFLVASVMLRDVCAARIGVGAFSGRP